MKTVELIRLTSRIVAAYVSRHHVFASDLPDLIARIHGSLRRLAVRQAQAQPQPSQARVEASVTRNRIVSFIDGKPYKSLKWHLAAHGLTPDQYRARFGLPATYPMTAPRYDEPALRGTGKPERTGKSETSGKSERTGKKT